MNDNHFNTESVNGGTTIPTVEKKRCPTVLRLRLELADYDGEEIKWDEDELTVLQKYAKVKTGFWREVLVPSSMRLKSLHFVIQTLFGWQNSHLHSFTLMDDSFMSATDGGNISKWEELCGLLFHFPEDDDDSNRYSDEIYDSLKPYKEWVKEMYSSPVLPLCVSNTYIRNQQLVDEFEKSDFRKSHGDISTIEDLNKMVYLGEDCNNLLECLTVDALLRPITSLPGTAEWLNRMSGEIKAKKQVFGGCSCGQGYDELIEKFDCLQNCKNELTNAETFRQRGVYLGLDYVANDNISCHKSEVIAVLESVIEGLLSIITPGISPLTDTLLYHYDYGDGWCVKVTCEDVHSFDEESSHSGKWGGIVTAYDGEDKSGIRFFYSITTGEKAPDELTEPPFSVAKSNTPVCIAAEGLRLLDDVGGIRGFVDMLRTIHGKDKEQAEEMREWAKEMGWSNRMPKLEKML